MEFKNVIIGLLILGVFYLWSGSDLSPLLAV